jgi:uncharacterized protein YbjT (DUF2867 family)
VLSAVTTIFAIEAGTDGNRCRHGDFADPATLAGAFAGATRLGGLAGPGRGQPDAAPHRGAMRAP